MSDSFVTSAKIDGQNNIVLTLKVGGFISGQAVEISGYAVQGDDYGGFATFSKVQTIKPNKDTGIAELAVKATTAPGKGFITGYDVTVVLQVSKVWMTVLSENPSASGDTGYETGAASQPARKGWTWDNVKGVGGPDKYPPASQADQPASGTASTDQPAVGGSSSPQAGAASP